MPHNITAFDTSLNNYEDVKNSQFTLQMPSHVPSEIEQAEL